MAPKRIAWLWRSLLVAVTLASFPAVAQLQVGLARDSGGRTFIADIDAFLTTCPQDDPALPEILAAFKFRRNGQPYSPSLACTEPASWFMRVAPSWLVIICCETRRRMP